MIGLFAHPRFNVAWMLWCAFLAWANAYLGSPLLACLMIACSCGSMFQVWGDLRRKGSP